MSNDDQLEQAQDDQGPEQEQAPVVAMSIMDILREQAALNEKINYKAAKVKGQSIVRGK
jgi:hypothetical protein